MKFSVLLSLGVLIVFVTHGETLKILSKIKNLLIPTTTTTTTPTMITNTDTTPEVLWSKEANMQQVASTTEFHYSFDKPNEKEFKPITSSPLPDNSQDGDSSKGFPIRNQTLSLSPSTHPENEKPSTPSSDYNHVDTDSSAPANGTRRTTTKTFNSHLNVEENSKNQAQIYNNSDYSGSSMIGDNNLIHPDHPSLKSTTEAIPQVGDANVDISSSLPSKPNNTNVPVDGGRTVIKAPVKECGEGRKMDGEGNCKRMARK